MLEPKSQQNKKDWPMNEEHNYSYIKDSLMHYTYILYA